MNAPYLSSWGVRGPFTILIVDGAYVRKNLDEGFTNWGQPMAQHYIPNYQIWLDLSPNESEYPFFVSNAIRQYWLMKAGVPYDQAVDLSDLKERSERTKAGLLPITPGNGSNDVLYLKTLNRLSNGVVVSEVKGETVRDRYDLNFTAGGHWLVYPYVPYGNVWIDNSDMPTDILPDSLHEITEYPLMAGGMSYNEAHAVASNTEHWARECPELLNPELALHGWSF